MHNLYCIFYKETKDSQWAVFRLLMKREDANIQRKYSDWYKSKIKLISVPLDLK